MFTDLNVRILVCPLRCSVPKICPSFEFFQGSFLGAGLGAARRGKMASGFLQATPDRAVRFFELIGC